MTTATTTPKSFASHEAAVKALARALGYRGAAGGWIYRPLPEFAELGTGHSAQGGTVPSEWAHAHVCQGWGAFERRVGWKVIEVEGRFTFDRAELGRFLEETRGKARAAYAKYLDHLADGSASADMWKARFEGLRNREHALYDLLHKGGKS
jgi:hypothetical protein